MRMIKDGINATAVRCKSNTVQMYWKKQDCKGKGQVSWLTTLLQYGLVKTKPGLPQKSNRDSLATKSDTF